jgi:hypothetical protein
MLLRFFSCDVTSLLPMLTYLVKNGNVTYYEYLHGKAPTEIVTSAVDENNDMCAEDEDEKVCYIVILDLLIFLDRFW